MDDVTAAKMNFRKEQWKQFILDRQASGLTINNWCQQHGFKRTTYFYWLRRIRKEACQTVPEPQATTPVPFVQIGSETVPSTVSNPLTEPKAVSPETAIQQIKDRHYPDALKDFEGDILLVGISYDKDDEDKHHQIGRAHV